MRTVIIFFVALNFLVSGALGQHTTREKSDKLKNYLQYLEQNGFSASVLISLDDKIVLSQGYGYANSERHIQNDSATVFDIGSITKQFTAAAILKLEMQGKLSTSDKLPAYFGNVPSDKSGITLHDLLRHQSGLISNVGKDFEKITTEAFIDTVMHSKLRFTPASAFSYSNIGYSLLAMIIEKVSGQSYETYLYENIWRPSQMEFTGYRRPEFDSDKIAVGYYKNDSAWGKPVDKEWDINGPYWHLKGNGGILSTTADMFRWHQSLLTDTVLSKDALQKYFHPELRDDESKSSYYAYGWDVLFTKRNTKRIWHNGSNRIFYADMMRYIDEGTALIMLSNKQFPEIDQVIHELSRIVFLPGYNPLMPARDTEANRNFTEGIINIVREQGLVPAKAAYENRNKDLQLLEHLLRNTGFDMLFNEEEELAVKIFELNDYAFPGSIGPLQALAEGYMETGDNARALVYFEKAAAIDPDIPFVNAMIRELEKTEK